MNEPPIFQLLWGQAERKQNGWVTLSQHPANAAPLHHSSLELNSVAKTNKESNYYCWNLNWPSPTILPKGKTLIEMFISKMRGRKKKDFIHSLMDSWSSIAPKQSQAEPLDSHNGSDKKSVIPRHSPMTQLDFIWTKQSRKFSEHHLHKRLQKHLMNADQSLKLHNPITSLVFKTLLIPAHPLTQ